MGPYLGDFKAGKTVYAAWDTQQNGLPITASSATVKVYKNAVTTTEVTTGVTTSLDFDALTGMHMIAIDLSSDGSFYAAGNDYQVALTALTVSAQTVRIWLGTFSIENRCVNWAQVVSPTTTVGLTGTTVALTAAGVQAIWDALSSALTTVGSIGKRLVDDLTGDIYARLGAPAGASVSADVAAVKAVLPAALVSGRIDASVGAMAAGVVTSTAIGADAITAAKIADGAIDAATFASGAINAAAIAADAITAAKIADGAIDAATFAAGAINAAAIATDAITAAKIAADAIGASELAADAVTEIQSGLSTLTQANVRTAVGLGSANLDTQLAGIQADTDDLQTRIPASLDANGFIKADVEDWKGATAPAMTGDAFARLGAPAGASVSADVAAVKADTAAIKLKTDNLPSDPADASDIAGAFSTVNTNLSTIAGYIDTEVAAIKAKTDNLPASPAAVGSAMTLTSGERDSIADAHLDRADAIETGLTPRQAMRLGAAADAGEVAGAATTTVEISNAVANDKVRITATVDSDGNRTAVTTDLT